MQVFLKGLQIVIAKRFAGWCEERGVFGPEQYGFIAKRRIETPIADILGVLEEAKMLGREVHMVSLDIRKAYDTVDLTALREGLRDLGVEEGFVAMWTVSMRGGGRV